MTGNELVELFEKGTKRCHVIGDLENGVVAGLDLEGRLFTILNGQVVNCVRPEAILGITTRSGYLNPGGDGLWPAPEGTCLGYEYASGAWRVPPGLTGAKYIVTTQSENHAVIEAEVDLINAAGTGIPTIFRRDVAVLEIPNGLLVKVVESIEYIGNKTLTQKDCLLSPWSLCQFNCGPDCEVMFPEVDDSQIWDLYDPSDTLRFKADGKWHTKTEGGTRYQIGLGEQVPWIELKLSTQNLTVKRGAARLPKGQQYIDIVDAPPSVEPSDKGVRFSVYNDSSDFMEIEAAGGCPETISPGTIMSVEVTTEYTQTAL